MEHIEEIAISEVDQLANRMAKLANHIIGMEGRQDALPAMMRAIEKELHERYSEIAA